MQFKEVVNFVSVPELKRRVEKFPVRGSIPSRKAEMISFALKLSTSSTSLSDYWDTLNTKEKNALQEAVHTHDGILDEEYYFARYKQPHPTLTRQGYYASPDEDARLLTCFYPRQRYGLPEIIPDEILTSLKQVVPKPEKYFINISEELPTTIILNTVRRTDKAEVREYLSCQYSETELHALLNLIKQCAVKVSEKTGNPSKAQISKLATIVKDYYDADSESEDHVLQGIKILGWLQILRSASWITVKNGVLHIRESKFNYGQPTHEVLSGLFKDWLQKSEQDELSRINHIKGQSGKGKKYLTKLTLRRESIAKTLARCPVDKWIAVDEFLDLIVINKNFFPVSVRPDHFYIGDAHYGRIYDNNLPWTRYNLCLLMEYMTTLGIIDIAYSNPDFVRDDLSGNWGTTDMSSLSRYDGLQYIRLTRLGAWIVGQSDSYTPAKLQEVTTANVMSDGRLHFQSMPQSNETLFLSTYANEISSKSWQLCQEKMISYLETGSDLDDLLAFISERDPQPFLPDEIESLFKKLQQNKQAVVSGGKVLLLTCSSKKVAQQISDTPELTTWCQRVGNTQLIIPINKENLFRKIIHQLHYAMPVSKN